MKKETSLMQPNGLRSGGSASVQLLTTAAIIAAIYTVLTLVFQPISFGAIQFRISEMLCILPFFSIAGIPGVTLGCLLGNLLGGAALPDIVFGTLATFLGALGTYAVGRTSLSEAKLLALLPPVLSNAIIIPFVLKYAYGTEGMLWYFGLTVGIGEILAVGVLGSVLGTVLEKYKKLLFPVS